MKTSHSFLLLWWVRTGYLVFYRVPTPVPLPDKGKRNRFTNLEVGQSSENYPRTTTNKLRQQNLEAITALRQNAYCETKKKAQEIEYG